MKRTQKERNKNGLLQSDWWMSFLSKIWELLLDLHSALPILETEIPSSRSSSWRMLSKQFVMFSCLKKKKGFKLKKRILLGRAGRGGGTCFLCKAGDGGADAFPDFITLSTPFGGWFSLPPSPPPHASLWHITSCNIHILNVMGALVYYSFSIARMGQSGDEWFIRKSAQG